MARKKITTITDHYNDIDNFFVCFNFCSHCLLFALVKRSTCVCINKNSTDEHRILQLDIFFPSVSEALI